MIFTIKYFSFNSDPKKGKRDGREEERERKMSDNNKNRESISKCVKRHISLHRIYSHLSGWQAGLAMLLG